MTIAPNRTNRYVGQWLRDLGLGAIMFLLLPAFAMPVTAPRHVWSVSEAMAGEVIASRAIEVSAPAGPTAENAIVAAAQLRPASDPLLYRKVSDFAVLWLTFSLLVSFNLAFWRHLRHVNAASRSVEASNGR